MKSRTMNIFGAARSLAMTACIAAFITLVLSVPCAQPQEIDGPRFSVVHARDKADLLVFANRLRDRFQQRFGIVGFRQNTFDAKLPGLIGLP